MIGLILGMISPKLVIRWGIKEKQTRGKALLIYGLAIVVTAIGLNATSPQQPHAAKLAAKQQAKTTSTTATPTVQPWRQLTKPQQADVQILNADLGVIVNDAQNHDLASFAVDLKGQEQDVAAADNDILGRPLNSKDSFQNVFTVPANISPSSYHISPNQLFRTLVYSMQSVDSDIANPSTGSGSYMNDLGNDVESVRNDAAEAQQVCVVLGYPN
jgi:hypothetical protein